MVAPTKSRPAARSLVDRVLVHAPYGRDGPLLQHELAASGFFPIVCKSIPDLCEEIGEGAGAALVADESLVPAAVNLIAEQLRHQPPWSDFPLLVMTSGGAATGFSRYRLQLLEPLTNVTLLERPLRPETLTSSLRAALRARHRQYQLCELLSELAENNGELKRTNHELTRVNRELEEFAWVASHDLQEPLRMVNIYTQLICEKFGGEKGTDPDLNLYAGFVGQGVHRMERLIRDLLTFSRTVHIESRDGTSADLSTSLAQAISILKNRIEENATVIHAESLPVVHGDAPQLAQVFQNLISNSIKYRKAEETPRIEITSEHKNGEWITAVQDNGIGFDQQYADSIFGLFKRLHKDEYPGTGLGLAICQRIVERYGGRMWATSKDGEGATFYFALHPAL
jgi:signal transduction histidine kinase